MTGPLSRPSTAVLPESMATKLFGDDNPIGKTVTLDSLEATVRTVVADPPPNSRIRFDLAMTVREIPNWGAYHYVRLAENTRPKDAAPKITAVMEEIAVACCGVRAVTRSMTLPNGAR